jgi:type I restriction enzyme M protein
MAPFVPDAWIDHSKTKIGFEIPFMRQFYSYKEPRPVNEIKVEIEDLESEIQLLMRALK